MDCVLHTSPARLNLLNRPRMPSHVIQSRGRDALTFDQGTISTKRESSSATRLWISSAARPPNTRIACEVGNRENSDFGGGGDIDHAYGKALCEGAPQAAVHVCVHQRKRSDSLVYQLEIV